MSKRGSLFSRIFERSRPQKGGTEEAEQPPQKGQTSGQDQSAADAASAVTAVSGLAAAPAVASRFPDVDAGRLADEEEVGTKAGEPPADLGKAFDIPDAAGTGFGNATGTAPPAPDSSLVGEAEQLAQQALSELAQRRGEALGNLQRDVASSAGEPSATLPASGHRDFGSQSLDVFMETVSGDEAHAAEVATQILTGDTGIGNRMADAEAAISLGAALMADQDTRATSPASVQDGGALQNAIDSVSPGDLEEQAKKAGVTTDSAEPQGWGESEPEDPNEGPGEPEGTPAEARGPFDAIVEWISGEREFEGEIDIAKASPSRDFSIVDDGIGNVGTASQGSQADAAGVSNLETAAAKTFGSAAGGGVKDPGTDPDLVGGPPTAGEIAFREALMKESGRRIISGDVDPVEEGSTPVGKGGDFAAIAESRSAESMVGQPPPDGLDGGGLRTGGQGPVTGLDIDPLEGDAFSGPSLGGNPEDLDMNIGGSPIVGLEPPRSDDDEEDEEEGSAE